MPAPTMQIGASDPGPVFCVFGGIMSRGGLVGVWGLQQLPPPHRAFF